MGADQSKFDYNYGQIIERDNLCEKRLQYDINAKDVFLQSLTSIPILKSFEEVDKITFCGSQNEIKAFFSYNQITLHRFVLTQEFTLKETQIVCIIKQILSNLNQNKVQIHPKEILLPEYIMLDPELFLQKSDVQRIRQGNIKHQDYYLAPEVLTGKCKSNITAQIFSLGLVCLFIMTKSTPFDFNIYDTTSFQQLNLQKYINKINTGIYSQLLKNVIIDMLKEDPKLRINEDQIICRLDEVLMFHSQKTLKFQESAILMSVNSSKIKLDLNEELKQSQLSYNYKERPSENQKCDKEKKLSKHTANNSPQTNHQNRQNKENIELEFITKKEKRTNNYSFSACSSRSHIRGMSIKPAKKQVYQDKHTSIKQRWK
ncbi:unnamed protein product [Paramecium primaurelia]|uniref:Protein kinase domain-containing protein n=2 Tax=Paramecium primaurelia TaxID=5886 RepID=A0A8S1KWX2_PARPR|nr:unnamed protein product [Paramecium primaurelia]